MGRELGSWRGIQMALTMMVMSTAGGGAVTLWGEMRIIGAHLQAHSLVRI